MMNNIDVEHIKEKAQKVAMNMSEILSVLAKKKAIFVFDILADDNRDYRVINNQKRHPDDFIEKIEK